MTIQPFSTRRSAPITTDGYVSSGPSPTLHLLGPGQVGGALLRQLATTRLRLVGVTDSSATLCLDPHGPTPSAIANLKSSGLALERLPNAQALPLTDALQGAHLVADALPTDLANASAAVVRARAVLATGACLALAAKDALCAAPELLFSPEILPRVGLNAALGGTGLRLKRELNELRAHTRSVAIVANASTTIILTALEQGASLDAAIADAQARGVLEPDPTLDLDGTDALVKLGVVWGALYGRPLDRSTVARVDIRSLNPDTLVARAQRGCTTRLVGRIHPDGQASLGFEELPADDPLAVGPDRVAYTYTFHDGQVRVHIGDGLGPIKTARALLDDLLALCAPPITHVARPQRAALPAYELFGPTGAPVVLVQGGISAHRHVAAHPAAPQPGWWEDQVGPNKAIDAGRFRVLCTDFLTHGDPLTPATQARALANLLDHLGVEQLHSFIGASYGGMVGLSFAALFPRRLGQLVAISAPDAPHPQATAWRSLQRRVVELGRRTGAPEEALAIARGIGMVSYRSPDELFARFSGPPTGPRAPVEDYLHARGADFARRFDPVAFLALSQALDLHYVDPATIRTPTTLVAVRSDQLVPLAQLRALYDRLGGPRRIVEIESLYGHDAFLKESATLSRILRDCLGGAA